MENNIYSAPLFDRHFKIQPVRRMLLFPVCREAGEGAYVTGPGSGSAAPFWSGDLWQVSPMMISVWGNKGYRADLVPCRSNFVFVAAVLQHLYVVRGRNQRTLGACVQLKYRVCRVRGISR